MKKLLLATAATLLFVSNASADTYTFTVTGTVSLSGGAFDTAGIFGTPQTTLGGDSYVATYTLDTSTPGALHYVNPGVAELFEGGTYYGSSIGSPVTASITINGYTYNYDTSFASRTFVESTEAYASVNTDLYFTYMYFDVYSISDVPVSFAPFTYTFGLGAQENSRFQVNGANGAFGDLVIDTVTLTGDPQPVPGPIVGAGLPGLFTAAMLWLARRRKQKAV